MNRRLAAAWIGGALGVVVVTGFWLLRDRSSERGAGAAGPADDPAASATELAAPALLELQRITLWLPGGRGRVAAWTAEVEAPPTDPSKRARAILEALLAARPDPASGAAPLFDQEVELAHTLLAPDGTLYVDLRRPDGGPPPGAGSTLEIERIYSIVQTATGAEPAVERVVLLWNGEQRLTLAGHVDTSRPLVPRPELERR